MQDTPTLTLQVKFSPELRNRLDRFVTERSAVDPLFNTSRTAVINVALREYLDREERREAKSEAA